MHVGIGGGAATPVTDGFLSIIHVGNAGMCRIDCVEVDELGHPMHVVRRGIVPDTEGAGTFRGAPSIYGEFGPIEGCTMKVLYTADGTINSAMGAHRRWTRRPGACAEARARRFALSAARLLWRDARAR